MRVRPQRAQLARLHRERAPRSLHGARRRLELTGGGRISHVMSGSRVVREIQRPQRRNTARIEQPRLAASGARIEGDDLATLAGGGDDLLDVVHDLRQAVAFEPLGHFRRRDPEPRRTVARKEDRTKCARHTRTVADAKRRFHQPYEGCKVILILCRTRCSPVLSGAFFEVSRGAKNASRQHETPCNSSWNRGPGRRGQALHRNCDGPAALASAGGLPQKRSPG